MKSIKKYITNILNCFLSYNSILASITYTLSSYIKLLVEKQNETGALGTRTETNDSTYRSHLHLQKHDEQGCSLPYLLRLSFDHHQGPPPVLRASPETDQCHQSLYCVLNQEASTIQHSTNDYHSISQLTDIPCYNIYLSNLPSC